MKLPLFAYLLCGLLLFLTAAVHSQSCPEGYEVTGGQGAYGCAPRPDYDNSTNQQQQQQQTPQPPSPQWATRWGAIATDPVKGSLGAITGLSSKSEAQQAAMADCQAKDGARCQLDLAYDNECAAVVVGDGGYNVSSDRTADKAGQLGLHVCTKAGRTNCHVYYSACSLPVRIQ